MKLSKRTSCSVGIGGVLAGIVEPVAAAVLVVGSYPGDDAELSYGIVQVVGSMLLLLCHRMLTQWLIRYEIMWL